MREQTQQMFDILFHFKCLNNMTALFNSVFKQTDFLTNVGHSTRTQNNEKALIRC